GVGRVHAARFIASGREFNAFHFDKQGAIAYFDEEGNSLRKTFLAAPVKYSRISSRYTGRRFHPVLKRYRSHLGTDYAAPFGTPIRATGDGEVVEAAYKKGNGRYVKIRHNGTYTTAYLHMSRIATGIRRGKYVRQGDIIGYVGSTGLARGNHVCYRFWKHGRQVDPLKETFPSAEPVLAELREAFDMVRMELVLQLGLPTPDELPPYAFMMK
ncbi:MAG: M23 family metallopeptidase, partial [Rhodothermia bacterium]|nr:M23 family metallopeptidase [Rhodothermia bacterium]